MNPLYYYNRFLQTPQEFLAQSGRRISSIKGDGNCLFRALAFHILGDEELYYPVRSFLVRFESKNSDLFATRLIPGRGLNKPTIREHINHLMRPGTWGTHVELQAIATYYQVPIYICIHNRKNKGYHWEITKPICGHSEVHFPLQVCRR